MSIHPISFSPFVVLLAMGVVYVDATYRSLARKTWLRWICAVGFVSIGGFLCVFVFQAQLARIYLLVSGESVLTPGGLLTGVFIMGVVISVLAVSVYGVGSRAGHIA
jgi:hypothetical protein